MTPTALPGLIAANPLGFLASLGLLRIVSRAEPSATLSFSSTAPHAAIVAGFDGSLAELVADDAKRFARKPKWWVNYPKLEKRGMKTVADLKAPPEVFREYLQSAIVEWVSRDMEGGQYLAAFGTDVAVDGKGNTKPTAFHFTAANQQFLGTIDEIREKVSTEWAQQSLFEGAARQPGQNVRWDPASERSWALMAGNPVESGTTVDAPAEWLAFRALPFFPCFPVGRRVVTTAMEGTGNEMEMCWPIWTRSATAPTIRSILQIDWVNEAATDRTGRGIVAICRSMIRRSAQGFGNFGPASLET